MKFGGLQKFSLIDYPAKVACVLFVQGCSFRCPFCHNPSLVDPKAFTSLQQEEDILRFLEKRRGKLDGIVISGGEPTLFPQLPSFLKKIQEMGFSIKLDTNGNHPSVIQKLLEASLIDYIAMDIKAPLEKYSQTVNMQIKTQNIEKSINHIMHASIPYEFRTTLVPTLHDEQDIEKMALLIANASLYILQKFQPANALHTKFQTLRSFSDPEMKHFQNIAQKHVMRCDLR
ncbi:MAG: anaerobic ribonucleoside-triphosphate reductase activating protein [Parachlamydiales bacterium]|nr:anaerobic ribonucleoside-triphosphate reductase activating protein [Parachlamydiales bacterium]